MDRGIHKNKKNKWLNLWKIREINYTHKWISVQGGYQGKNQKHRIKLE
jgi:hypothetical protein